MHLLDPVSHCTPQARQGVAGVLQHGVAAVSGGARCLPPCRRLLAGHCPYLQRSTRRHGSTFPGPCEALVLADQTLDCRTTPVQHLRMRQEDGVDRIGTAALASRRSTWSGPRLAAVSWPSDLRATLHRWLRAPGSWPSRSLKVFLACSRWRTGQWYQYMPWSGRAPLPRSNKLVGGGCLAVAGANCDALSFAR